MTSIEPPPARASSPRRRAVLLAAALLLLAAPALAGSYLNRASFLIRQATQEGDYLRARFADKELALLIHKLAVTRLEAASKMEIPKEVVQAHPHLLLMLENYERSADAAIEGKAERFMVYQQRARDEERTFRGVLKQLGYTLPADKEK
jgi:hypothetical protein